MNGVNSRANHGRKPKQNQSAQNPAQQPPQATPAPQKNQGPYGGYTNLASLIGAQKNANIQPQTTKNPSGQKWTDNNNPAVLAYQNMDDNDLGHFLHQTDSHDLSQYKDKWGFYDNPSQKLISSLGINGKPTVLSKKDFDNFVSSTNAEVIYRGWSGKDSRERFMKSDFNHIGTGRYGDGLYFGSARTASGYGRTQTQAVLGPNTKMIDVNTLRRIMRQMPRSAQKAMRIAGTTGSRQYYNDVGGEMQMAIKLGYNCIDAGWCKVVIDRSILIVRDT